ncbi:hypothetical protein TNCV_1090241 [Trichonephila clavipes]|uniref:Uncharacterized protein n=1 Tax=Trichonephila clavipes TaxID=2585209 RepID=A0A8X6STQ3_TRICX|nr:hypothetical protein TNCV_1090241 [Trichonephila clavipes]
MHVVEKPRWCGVAVERSSGGNVTSPPWFKRSVAKSPRVAEQCDELLPYGQTLNSDIYCQQLDRLKLAIDQKGPEFANRRGVVFHQDNLLQLEKTTPSTTPHRDHHRGGTLAYLEAEKLRYVRAKFHHVRLNEKRMLYMMKEKPFHFDFR